MISQAQEILKDVFGYDEFRPLQQQIIENVLNRKDTVAIMPTGGGKSICYQIPALIFEGLTVVISPLISLMTDQIGQLHELGIPTVVLNSSLTQDEYTHNISMLKRGEAKMLYLAPETLVMDRTLQLLMSLNVACITIDEAHCISEWGHDFRPEYRQIAQIKKKFPNSVCIALTATATPQVQTDIRTSLDFSDSETFLASFDRDNLFIEIADKNSPLKQTVDYLNRFPEQSGIIYCLSRRQVDELSADLSNKGFSVKPYHAGLTDEERHQNQQEFIRDDVQIIVATVAFGMGINKPNVRFVLHHDLPKDIESYYQQIGRAGRDGLQSHCMLLFSYADIHKIKFFISQKSGQEQRVATMNLNALVSFAEADECRRIPLLNYFGEVYHGANCEMCDNCLAGEVVLHDLTIPAQKFLSCVKRTGERFGAGHIIDVLRGSRSQKILQCGHHTLSTYAIGKDLSKQQWFHLSRQFIQKELLVQDMQFGGLALTKKAWDVMLSEILFHGKIEELKRIKKSAAPKNVSNEDYDHTLFEILRAKRKELADAASIPPYAVFSDRSLIAMSVSLPETDGQFMKVHGVGAAKREKYGNIFMTLISEYTQSLN